MRAFAQGAELEVFTSGSAPLVAEFQQIEPLRQAFAHEPRPVRDFLNAHRWLKNGIAGLLALPAVPAALVLVISPNIIHMAYAAAVLIPVFLLATALGIGAD